MRTRIRCPLCGALAWESNFEKGPYNLDIFAMDCKKSKGKGHGRNTFKFLRVVADKLFKQRVLESLYNRIKVLEQHLRIQLGGNEWQKSKNVWIRPVQDTSYLTMTESSSNQKTHATPSRYLKTLKKNSKR